MKGGLGSWREARGGNDKLREKWVWKDTWEDEGKLSREGGEGELGPGREGIGWRAVICRITEKVENFGRRRRWERGGRY